MAAQFSVCEHWANTFAFFSYSCSWLLSQTISPAFGQCCVVWFVHGSACRISAAKRVQWVQLYYLLQSVYFMLSCYWTVHLTLVSSDHLSFYRFVFYTWKQLLLSARLSHRNSVCPFVRLSVCHTGGSVKNNAR